MRNVTLDLSTLHLHGRAFYDYLKLRKSFFVDTLDWDIPHNNEVEMDQYDNPTAHYSIVVEGGRVLGGARIMPTSAEWGPHTYMLGDAAHGRLHGIPGDLLEEAPASGDVWECTRLVMSESLSTHEQRNRCLSLIVGGLVDIAERHGASRLISLSPLPLMRTLRQLGYDAGRIGAIFRGSEDGRRYSVLAMPTERRVGTQPRKAPAPAEAEAHEALAARIAAE